MFKISKNANPNYLAKIIKISNVRKHPNADRLEIITVDGCNIIAAKKSYTVGDIVVFCPTEVALNKEFLAANNQFEEKELNKDKDVKGYFNHHGRVRAINLRGEPSRGFIVPLKWLENWLDCILPHTVDELNELINVEFDTFNGVVFCKKYIPIYAKSRNEYAKGNKRNNRLKRFDRLVEGQFKFHYDSLQFANHLDKIEPNDIISITRKMHGTSFVCAKVLVNRKLNLFEKLLKKIGVKIEDKEYDTIISSRTVIKNRYINQNQQSFYDVDVWSDAAKIISPLLSNGETVYAEIVGYLPNSRKMIHKNYNYDCNEGEYDIYVYRVTKTNNQGEVFELSANDVQLWCASKGLKAVHQYYYGRANMMYPNIDNHLHKNDTVEDWRQDFFDRLKEDKEFNMEGIASDCLNDVPEEGIVIRNDSKWNCNAMKLKCENFYIYESKVLDEGEVDIETSEGEGSEVENTHIQEELKDSKSECKYHCSP